MGHSLKKAYQSGSSGMHCHDTVLMRLVARLLNFLSPTITAVIPAKAGIHLAVAVFEALWIPAFAGMTGWPRATVLKPLVIAFQNESSES